MKRHLKGWGCLAVLVFAICVLTSFFNRYALRDGDFFRHPADKMIQALISTVVLMAFLIFASGRRKR